MVNRWLQSEATREICTEEILFFYFRFVDLHELQDIIFLILRCQIKEIMLGQTSSQDRCEFVYTMLVRKLREIRPRRKYEHNIQRILQRFFFHIETRNSMIRNYF